MNSTSAVLILGASDQPQRYAHRAFLALKRAEYPLILVHPSLPEVEGHPVIPNLEKVNEPIDTITLYVSAKHSTPLESALIGLKPRRVIFNPGTENEALQLALENAGIEVIEGCTLVMLATGQF